LKNKAIMLVVSITIISSLVVIGCAKPAPGPTPEKPVEIIFQAEHPRPQFLTVHAIEPWVMGFEEKSGGRLKMFYYDRDGVVPCQGLMDAVADNILQTGVVCLVKEPGRYPLTEVVSLPFTAASSTISSLVAWHLYQEFPEWRAEFPEGVNILTHFVSASFQIHTVDKPIRTVDDLKGMKMIGINAWAVDVLGKVGAIPSFVNMPDVYENLSKGMAEGVLCPLAPVRAMKVAEVAKYHTIINLCYDCFAVPINRGVFESLPADLQQLIADESGAKISEACGKALDEGSLGDCEWMIENGGSFYKLSPGEMEKFVQLIMPLRQDWVAEMEAKGLPGQAVLDEALRYSAELEAQGIYVPAYPTE